MADESKIQIDISKLVKISVAKAVELTVILLVGYYTIVGDIEKMRWSQASIKGEVTKLRKQVEATEEKVLQQSVDLRDALSSHVTQECHREACERIENMRRIIDRLSGGSADLDDVEMRPLSHSYSGLGWTTQ